MLSGAIWGCASITYFCLPASRRTAARAAFTSTCASLNAPPTTRRSLSRSISELLTHQFLSQGYEYPEARLAMVIGSVVLFEAQFLDFAGKCVAAHSQQDRGFDSAPAGMGKRSRNQRSLELAGKFLEDRTVSAFQQRFRFPFKRSHPVLRRGNDGRLAQLGGEVLDVNVHPRRHDRQPVA